MSERRFTDSQEANIAEAYRGGESIRRLSLRHKTDDHTILSALRRQGTPTRTRAEARALAKKLKRYYRILTWDGVRRGLRVAIGEPDENGMIRCVCDCGKEQTVPLSTFRKRTEAHSCGCLAAKVNADRTRTHDRSYTPEYTAWARMIQRCHNPKNGAYKNYGGRGIAVCNEWLNSFETFFAHVGLRPSAGHSLDRYPVQSGNYQPGNVRWATREEQQNNLRTNISLTHEGQTLTLSEWARKLGLPHRLLRTRYDAGWPPAKILAMPRHTRQRPRRRGVIGTPEHVAWAAIVQRCCNSTAFNYPNYGGKGIDICRRWRESSAAFIEDMGPRPTSGHRIDRIDNSKGYHCGQCDECRSKGRQANCRWATITEQNNNKSNNRMIEWQGEVKSAAEWGRACGLNPQTITARIDRYGWTIERALTTPANITSRPRTRVPRRRYRTGRAAAG